MGKRKGLNSTGEKVENLMEFLDDRNNDEENDFESDNDR